MNIFVSGTKFKKYSLRHPFPYNISNPIISPKNILDFNSLQEIKYILLNEGMFNPSVV